VSSAGLVLAALIGALVAGRRTRRAQRTIRSLQSLSVIKTPPIMIVGALLGAAIANTFGFTLQLFAYGLMIAMALEQTLVDFCTHRLARGVTMRAALAGGPLLTLAAILGWMGWSYVYIGLASGFILGGIWALALMIMGKANRSSHIPFGPFLCVGAVATLFAL
jgi:prepilin signal peptidase PulO-like enzyme (type II secretory pathway)